VEERFSVEVEQIFRGIWDNLDIHVHRSRTLRIITVTFFLLFSLISKLMMIISVDLVTLDDLSAAALLESSARIESLANAWDRMNSEPPLAAPLASLPDPTRTAGSFGQFGTLCKRYISYKQPGSLLSWISRLIVAAVLSLLLGCVFWDIPASDPQLTFNDRLGYHHTVMGIAFWPIILLMIRDIQNDRKHAEKDIKLGLYGRTGYIFVQSILSVLPSLCIWLAYLLPAHSMAGLYSYTSNSDAGIYLYMGNYKYYFYFIESSAW
jgi:ABC-2 type transporter